MRKIYSLKVTKMSYAGRVIAYFILAISLFKTTSSYSQTGLITNVTASSGHSYTLGELTKGTTIYSDRTYEATSVPSFLNNAAFIKTPNDDKANKATSSPTFNLTKSATVYIAYDPRATALPAWLNGWQKSSSQLGINDPNISNLNLYSKSFATGKVTLGGNLASPAAGALNMYLIMAVATQASQYTLSVVTSGSGTVAKNPNHSTYASGSDVSLTATPASGQKFTGWSGDATGTTNPLTVTMDADKSITATFAPASSTQYTLTVNTSGSGTVSKNPSQATYASGATVSLTATPASGQQFTGWSGDASGTTNPLSVKMTANKNITASFSTSSSALITNITATTGNTYTLGELVVGSAIYSDRTYEVTSVPSSLNHASLIKTPNDDKTSKATSLLSFNLTQSATVYVAYDPRATALPAWLSSWQKLSSQIGINDPKISNMALYSKNFASGKVTLGGNLASPAAGALNNYFVIASSAQVSQFTLSVTANGNGTVSKSPNQSSYASGASVTLAATPASGQQFTGWSGDASGSTNPLTVTMDADKSITANFASSGSSPSITAAPLSIYDNTVSGSTGINRTVTVTNNGAGTLSVSGINLSGSNTNQFALHGLPNFPASVGSGNSISFSIAFNPTSIGLKTATININSNDKSNSSITVPVRALGTTGMGGTKEPSLQSILNLLEIGANVGDDDITTTVINSNTTKQKAPLLGDEVSIQQFQKAAGGNITITPLGVFGPTANDPVLKFGWYNSGNTSSKSELFTVSNNPVTNGQNVNVNYSGALSFDPSSSSFGFYVSWPFFNNRLMYSEDKLNTFTGAIPHHVRVFPYKKNGVIVQNSYLVTFEDNTTGLDYNDLIFLVSNVKKFSSNTSVSNASLFVENTDGYPSNDHVVFSRIQVPWMRDSGVVNANHDSVKIRLHNNGIGALTITGLAISDNSLWKIDQLNGTTYNPATQLPATVAPGGVLDLLVQFIATGTGDTRVKLLHETLTITSNDDVNSDKQVFLDGLWQYSGEGSHEPYSHEVFSVFGYTTKSGYEHEDPDKGDTTKLKGDEIKPDYFVRADATIPVTVRELGAYHGCCYSTEHFKWFDKGTKIYNDVFLQVEPDGQTLLPRRLLNGSPSGGTFIPSNLPFGIDVGFNYSDPNKNPGKKLGVRVYKAIDGSGNIIPNTYLLGCDYLGNASTNSDYNDNMYYITNVKPYSGTAYNSPLNVTPSDVDFGEEVLQTNNSFQLNISSGGKTYSNGSQDPQLVISSIVITGENASEFAADMPLKTTLGPQEGTTIKVKFNPTSQGLKIADMLIYYNNSPKPKRVPLYGIAKASGVTVTANYRINSGASSPVTINGKTWAADNKYSFDNLEPFKNTGLKEIAGTDEDVLYFDEQSSNGDKKPFRYQFPVSNGTYYVRLHFAEVFWGAPGSGFTGGAGARVFNVKLENQYRLINFDPSLEVGGATAVIKNFPVTVTDGSLNIDFSAIVNRPMVCAVEVYSFSTKSLTSAVDDAVTSNQISEPLYSLESPRVYPNPLHNKDLTVEFPAKYEGIYNLQLIDILGRKYDLGITRLTGGGSAMKVDISRFSLKPGVYFLKIKSSADKADVLKLLIE